MAFPSLPPFRALPPQPLFPRFFFFFWTTPSCSRLVSVCVCGCGASVCVCVVRVCNATTGLKEKKEAGCLGRPPPSLFHSPPVLEAARTHPAPGPCERVLHLPTLSPPLPPRSRSASARATDPRAVASVLRSKTKKDAFAANGRPRPRRDPGPPPGPAHGGRGRGWRAGRRRRPHEPGGRGPAGEAGRTRRARLERAPVRLPPHSFFFSILTRTSLLLFRLALTHSQAEARAAAEEQRATLLSAVLEPEARDRRAFSAFLFSLPAPPRP